MPLSARDVDYALVNKLGFHRREGAHRIYSIQVGGVFKRTLMSRGVRELDDGMLATMARQIGITRRQFIQIIRCILTRSDYLRLIGVTQ